MRQQTKSDTILIRWQEESRNLKLEGEPVLEYYLSLPQLERGGRAGARISRYYTRLADAWRTRWGKALYWRACLSLVQCRESRRPFRPWTGKLSGAVTIQEADLLGLRLDGEETWGDGRTLRGCWGDVWSLKDGAPCELSQIMGGSRGWRQVLLEQAARTGNERRAAGDCFLDQGWEIWLRKHLSRCSFYLSPGQVDILLPQGAAAPAAEGVVALSIPRPGGGNPQPDEPDGRLFCENPKNVKIPLTILNPLI